MYLLGNILVSMNTVNEDPRQQRGLAIAQGSRLKHLANATWLVPSQSHSGGYVVDVVSGSCTCPDHELRGAVLTCKHRWAVEFARHRVVTPDGIQVTETVRITCSQNWPQYTMAQRNEKDDVQVLLRALCDRVPNTTQGGRGRPRASLNDVIFAATMKTFVGLSGRRADSDIRASAEKGLMDKAVPPNTIFDYMGREETTPILRELVRLSALPLAEVETRFAIDGTGFGLKVYRRWFDEKYGRPMKEAGWIKLHLVCGIETNIVTAVEVTDATEHDSPYLPQLMKETARGFDMKEVSADKGYLGVRNLEAIEAVGAVPYVAFKINSKPKGPDVWRRAFHMFAFHREQWLNHYGKRSNVEATFSSLKRKFGSAVRAKTRTATVNEVLLKCLAHNLSCLVHARYELGIDATFSSLELPS